MRGDKSASINYQEVSRENVTFTDGVKSHLLGKRTLNMEGSTKHDNISVCKGLKANALIKFVTRTCCKF